MRYITVSDVLQINEVEVGRNLLADFGLLESAVLRPQTSVGGLDAYPDVHAKAAALFHSLVRNHCFIDGNKRTGVLAVIVFYNLNGFDVIASSDDLIALAIDVAEGQLDVAGITGVLKGCVLELDLPTE